MSKTSLDSDKLSQWLDWKPNTSILSDSLESEPTKPSKPASVGFGGAIRAQSSEIEAGPEPEELERSTTVLNGAGVRIMRLDGQFVIGVWSDLDGPQIHAALRTLDMDRLPVRYLDRDGIPTRYKLRRMEVNPNAEINRRMVINDETEINATDHATSRLGNGGESGQVTRGVR
jgi:hypothetical protein